MFFSYVIKPLSILVLIILAFVIYNHFFGEVLYCMDGQIEGLLQDIAKKKSNCLYFQDQCKQYDAEFKRILGLRNSMEPDQWEVLSENARIAKKESDCNLNSERRMLNILEHKFKSRDFSEISTTPTVQKRKATDN